MFAWCRIVEGRDMGSKIRIPLLIAALIALVWFTPAISTPLALATQSVTDRFDSRPARDILFIGNSRTYYHDMPYMVRKMADSAHAPEKYKIVMHAPPGLTLKDHWNARSVHELLARRWQYVVIQAQSSEHATEAEDNDFHVYGAKLIAEARASGSMPVLYVGWRYEDSSAYDWDGPDGRTTYYDVIQRSHRQLAGATNTRAVNVGKAWEMLLAERPSFSLYEDGNHPTIYGSYLAALMFYAFFSGQDVNTVTYVPWGVRDGEASMIRKVVQDLHGSGRGLGL
jgi:hypothetical protein